MAHKLRLIHHHFFGKGSAGHGLMQLAAIGHGRQRPLIAIIGGFAAWSGLPDRRNWGIEPQARIRVTINRDRPRFRPAGHSVAEGAEIRPAASWPYTAGSDPPQAPSA